MGGRLPTICLLAVITMLAVSDRSRGQATTVESSPATAPATAPANATTVIIRLQGEIDDFNRDALFRRFKEARRLGAKTVILDVNTYGGLVTAGLEISRFLKQQDDVHVVAFIGEKAISAGAMIALAADEIVMAPSAMIGDSAPISVGSGGGMVPMGDAERAKAESPILEDFYESAVKNGYDPQLAQAMVQVGRTVHWVENTDGKRRFVNAEQYKQLTGDGWKPVEGVRDPIDAGNTLLTVTTDLAVKLGLARGTAPSAEALASERGLTIAATLVPTGGERLIGWLDNGIVRFVLMLVFMQSLYAALHAPGHGFPEVLALSSLGILVGIPMLTGYAQWWEVLAIILGLVLIALELFVIPGFGVTGISGIALFLFGLTMTFVGSEPSGLPGILPSMNGTWDALRQALFIVTGGMACSLMLWFWLNRFLPKMPYFNKLILSGVAGGATMTSSVGAPDDVGPAVGDAALALTDLRPSGSARLETTGGVTAVISDSGFVKAGARLVVREVSGNRIVVRPVA
jgi:membrane-bound serine protease (ClpP class)